MAEPRRLEILRLVRDRELAAGDISSHFDVARPAISQHLKVLADTRLVTVRKQGTRRLYRIGPEGLAELRTYLQTL